MDPNPNQPDDHPAERIRQVLMANRVFGDAYEVDGVKVIPVAKISGGGGGGGGGDAGGEHGSGIGLGMSATPVGVYVVADGQVRFEPAIDQTRVAVTGMFVGLMALWTIRTLIVQVGKARR